MAQNTNSVVVSGNLTRDAELVANDKICVFSIACNRGYGEYEKVNYFDIKLFGKGASVVIEYLTKGKHVTVTGEMDQETWEDKETGGKRSKIVVKTFNVELGARPQGGSGGKEDDIDNDKIPF